MADATGRDLRDAPGAGAAGGAGFGAMALLGAQVRSGAATVLELVGFADALPGADLVVTGEGSLDEQSLRGKAPFAVLAGARADRAAHGGRVRPLHARAGPDSGAGIARLWALTDREPDPARCMSRAGTLLEEVGEEIAGWLRTTG